MSLFDRLRYALYAAVIGAAAVGLAIALLSADVIGLLSPEAFDWITSPLYVLGIYIVAFALAPTLSEHFPISRGRQNNETDNEHAA